MPLEKKYVLLTTFTVKKRKTEYILWQGKNLEELEFTRQHFPPHLERKDRKFIVAELKILGEYDELEPIVMQHKKKEE